MKKIIFILTCLVLSFSFAFAQDAELMKKAQERYKNMTTLEADVQVTKHNTMLTKDLVSAGKFYFKKPSKMCLSVADGDILLMNGDSFTMVKNGQKQTMSGKGNNQLESFKTMMQNFTAGQESEIDLSDIADVDMETKGNLVTISVTPIISDPKQKRKMLFSSFEIVIDQKAGELKSVTMNEKGGNYTKYAFSNFKMNGNIADSVFSAQ